MIVFLCNILKESFNVCRPSFVDRWTRDGAAVDPRYISNLDINWDQISDIIVKLDDSNEDRKSVV